MTQNIDFFEDYKEKPFQFSIPKVLVGALLFMLFTAIAYSYFEEKKFKNSIEYLRNQNNKAVKNLDIMTEKYNLTYDENKRLLKDVKSNHESAVKYKDSMQNNREPIK